MIRRFLVLSALLLLATPTFAEPVSGTLGVSNTGRAGTDGLGRVLLFTPNPVQGGSSVSHWDRSATPNLLMEPSISSNLAAGQLDLTRPLMQDIGWSSGSSNIIIRVLDGPTEGFNDPSLGAQRMQAIERAAQIWGNAVRSSVPINLGVQFSDLFCSGGSGTLAQAGPQFVFDNFGGGAVPGTWYPGPLAEALANSNLSTQDVANPDAPDIEVTFNSNIDDGCLGAGSNYYYGLDGNEPLGDVDFLATALHEIGHGMGFLTLANKSTGVWFMNRPDIYGRMLLDNSTGQTWDQMTNAQRAASAINTNRLVWNGTRVTNQAPNFLNPAPALTLTEPESVAGRYTIGVAEFGPTISSPGVTGELIQAFDGSANPSEACNALVNGAEVAGNIALLDRGNCNFTVKVKNAQNAGARAVIVVNNQAGGPIDMGGTDGTITIPSAMVSRADGNRIKDALNATDPPGVLAFANGTVSVGEAAGSLSINVQRTGGTTGEVSVDYATANGTAVAGLDYTASSGTLTFADGDAGPRTIQIPIANDDVSEDTERFTVRLENPTGGATLGTPDVVQVNLADNEPCVANDTTACLLGGRFKVQVDWTDFNDRSGTGTLIPSEADTSALFWFFAEDNWELLLKMVDGCGFNDHFWVFSAATTNVEYTIRVTDIESGVTQEYFNALGEPAQAITDTRAFQTCP